MQAAYRSSRHRRDGRDGHLVSRLVASYWSTKPTRLWFRESRLAVVLGCFALLVARHGLSQLSLSRDLSCPKEVSSSPRPQAAPQVKAEAEAEPEPELTSDGSSIFDIGTLQQSARTIFRLLKAARERVHKRCGHGNSLPRCAPLAPRHEPSYNCAR
jgi:hypothetical protein